MWASQALVTTSGFRWVSKSGLIHPCNCIATVWVVICWFAPNDIAIVTGIHSATSIGDFRLPSRLPCYKLVPLHQPNTPIMRCQCIIFKGCGCRILQSSSWALSTYHTVEVAGRNPRGQQRHPVSNLISSVLSICMPPRTNDICLVKLPSFIKPPCVIIATV